MRIVHFEDVPFTERLPRHRDGRFEFRSLMTGAAGSLGNFNFEAVRTYGDFFSPRHRHNFDQYRYQIEGSFDFDRGGKMFPGSVAYFPEGTPYGPQSSSEDSLTVVLQLGGASGSGYLSRQEFLAGSADLAKQGEFRRGAFTQTAEDGQKRNKDGFEAVWEHVNKRKLEYPAQRYQNPIFMNPDSFSWVPCRDQGVSIKRLGSFGEASTTVGLVKLAPRASLELGERTLCFVLAGTGKADAGGWEARATLHLEAGEHARLSAETAAELLCFGLPDLSHLQPTGVASS